MRSRCLATVALFLASLGSPAQGQAGRSVAVLPFENAGSYGRDKEEFEALRRGLAATLGSELGRAGAEVVARDRTQRAVDTDAPGSEKVDLATAARIGKGLNARFVIAASFIDLYGDFRVDANIVDVATGEVVKVVRSDPKLSDRRQMFVIVRSVAARVAEAIQLARAPGPDREVPTDALTAYSRALLYRDRGDRQRAVEYLNQALKAFPGYPDAESELKRLQGG